MDIAPLLLDIYGRIPALVREAVEGLDTGQLAWRPGPGANPIGWLAWHIARVEDSQLAELTGEDQLWVSGNWAQQLGLEPDPANSGYGHSDEDVAAVRPEGPGTLVDYFEAAHSRMTRFLEALGPADLDRVVDERWDPPVTLGVRLVSIADDCLQHGGQAAYIRGLLAG